MAGKIIYGLNAVREALNQSGIVNRLYIAVETKSKVTAQLLDQAKSSNVRIDFVPQAKLNDLTGTQEHQGVAAAISPVTYATLEACLQRCGKHACLLVLDQVQHPKNVGLMIRTAVGAGVSGIILTTHGGMLLDDSIIRASAGTVLRIPVVCTSSLPSTLRELKEKGFWVYGLDADGDSSVFNTPWADRTVLVVGNETKGMRPTTIKACDAIVSIPLDNDLDSLNAAVATGIALFQVRQCHIAAQMKA